MNYLLGQADARRIPLADGCVQCVVTSPPYWGLRDYAVAGQIGLEATLEEFVAAMVAVFREVRRVLRPDGTVWLNLGDAWNAYNGNRGQSTGTTNKNHHEIMPSLPSGHGLSAKGLKPKDLIGIPWRVALALQADGWWLRTEIIWSKLNPMTESVTDRPSKSHEYLFLLTKRERYFYDFVAVREPMAKGSAERYDYDFNGAKSVQLVEADKNGMGVRTRCVGKREPPDGRNLRTVWTIPTYPFPGAHFATFPPRLVEPCIKAGTSEKGCCPACRAPWRRVTKSDRVRTRPGRESKCYDRLTGEELPANDKPWASERVGNRDPGRHVSIVKTIGWEPSCKCPAADPEPCLVADIFNGSGTTGVVATGLGRKYVGFDLSRPYLEMASRRIERPHARMPRGTGADESFPLFPAEARP